MRFALGAAFLISLFGTAAAGTSATATSKFRFADATLDSCLANCASQDASCKRVCPTTLSTPCLSSCDSQAETCKLSCQRR